MGEKNGHYCVAGQMWDIEDDGYPRLVHEPSPLNVAKAFLELFRDSDMRPEDECHVLYDAAEISVVGAESDGAGLRAKLEAAEAKPAPLPGEVEVEKLQRMYTEGHDHAAVTISRLESDVYRLQAQLTAKERECEEVRAVAVLMKRDLTDRAEAAEVLATKRGRHMARQSQHLYDTRQKLRKVEEERERYRERCEQLEAALRGGEGK